MKLLNITKLRDDCYTVTVQDNSYVIGTDENNANIYWTCSVVYNPVNGKESLKARIEDLISERKTLAKIKAGIETDIKPVIEAIDVSKILEVK